MKPKIIIIGAGGHARVVCEVILLNSEYDVVGFVDANIPVGTEVMNGLKVIANQNKLSDLKKFADHYFVAIGNNEVREKLFEELKQFLTPVTLIHPAAIISKSAIIESGSICLANTVVGANCTIGENCIVNAGTIVDHDSVIENNVHLSVGTMVGSNSMIGSKTTTTIGQNINSFSKV